MGAGHDHGHGHGHGPAPAGRLAISAAIFFLSFLMQGIGGLLTGSVGLISDALENLNDVLVNLMGLASLAIANRREPCDRYAFGFHRLEVLNTLFGTGMLVALAAAVAWEAWSRFRHPVPIQTGWVLVLSAGGLLLNVAAALALRDPEALDKDASLKAAYTHAFMDSLTSLALLAAILTIRFTGWRWIDPAFALAVVALILRGAYGLLKDALAILMHKAAFDHTEARAALTALSGVRDVQDLRSWKVCGHLTVASAHIVVEAERLEETDAILESIERVVASRFGVRHLTVHFETPSMADRHHHRFVHRHEEAADLSHTGHDHDHGPGEDHGHSH